MNDSAKPVRGTINELARMDEIKDENLLIRTLRE